jgi:DNA-binding NarL/FixJ family response regulator
MCKGSRVFIIDDHPVVRAGLRELLKQSQEICIVGDAEDGGAETLARLRESTPDVAIVDIKLKQASGVDVCREIKRTQPGVAVILLSAFWDDALVRQALDAGADGYLLKDAEHFDLAKGVATVARGEPFFDRAIAAAVVRQARGLGESERQLTQDDTHILQLVAGGLTNKAIGASLFLSHHTVRDRLSAIMASLGARNRTEAVQIASKRGLI